MNESRGDGDRMVFAATIILAAISVTMYFIVYLTLFRYQMLNEAGRAFSIVALALAACSMLLACYVALTHHGRLLTSPNMSGLGWVLICAGLIIGAPAVGADIAFSGNGSGGLAAALFLIIAGAAVLQAERNSQPATPDEQSRLN